jgi:pilus assembly protein CpaE
MISMQRAFQPLIEILQRSAPVSVLDVPHAGRNGPARCWLEVDEVVICAVPDLANLRNAKNMFDALKKIRPNDKCAASHAQPGRHAEAAGNIPNDFCEPLESSRSPSFRSMSVLFGNAANSGRMISEIDPKSPTAETFSQIAHIVTGRVAVKKAKKGGLGKCSDARSASN